MWKSVLFTLFLVATLSVVTVVGRTCLSCVFDSLEKPDTDCLRSLNSVPNTTCENYCGIERKDYINAEGRSDIIHFERKCFTQEENSEFQVGTYRYYYISCDIDRCNIGYTSPDLHLSP
ncbi:hypothetical protein C0J52_19962 [Blattella germanica]|nr:hypothetical protein C0J52_19962 [Blattella germanica]